MEVKQARNKSTQEGGHKPQMRRISNTKRGENSRRLWRKFYLELNLVRWCPGDPRDVVLVWWVDRGGERGNLTIIWWRLVAILVSRLLYKGKL